MLGDFLPIFPKMADGQEEAGLSSLAALRRENSNMQESFYTSLYIKQYFIVKISGTSKTVTASKCHSLMIFSIERCYFGYKSCHFIQRVIVTSVTVSGQAHPDSIG